MSRRAARPVGLRTRAFPLDDIGVDPGGDGRTVTAYAAVFDTPAEVRDQDGHYSEQIARAAFEKTLAIRGNNVGVFYNHGMTLYGTPSERASVPLGTPLEIRPDGRGLLTRTRYNRTALADEILESIRNGDIRGQSFTGRMLRSTPDRGPFRARSGKLTTVTRQEIDLKEYGPTPLPVYEDAAIVGVRASMLADTDRMLLELILAGLADGDAALDPIVDALCRTDEALDQAQAVIAQILGVPDPDAADGPDDDEPTDPADAGQRAGYMTRLDALAKRLDAAAADASGNPDRGRSVQQADRPALRVQEVRARLRKIGVLA